MTIRKSKRPIAAGNLHYPNEERLRDPEESGFSVELGEVNERLVDPEDDEGGDTHFPNEEKKPPRNNGRVSLRASQSRKVMAATDEDEEDEDDEDEDEVEASTKSKASSAKASKVTKAAKRVKAETKGPVCQQNTATLPNDVDPAEGYLPEGGAENQGDTVLGSDGEEEDLDDEDVEVDADVEDDAEFDESGADSQALITGEGWDEGEMGAEDMGPSDVSAADEDGAEDIDLDMGDEDDEVEAADMPGEGADETLPVVDVDGTEDVGDDVAFATVGSRVLALKANRVVAYMTRKIAASADRADVYLSDQFQEVVAAEMATQGLRKGLTSMGFVLAKINVGASNVLNKRVDAKVKLVTSATRRVQHDKMQALSQCMAIAAVGINRQHFPGAKNELRAALEAELIAAGVRNPSRLVRQVFAAHGVSYAKAIVMLAQKLADMPEVARNTIAETLDMTDELEMDDDTDLIGQEEAAVDDEDDFDTDDQDDVEAPTVEAALLRPVRQHRISAATRAHSTVTTAAILNGDLPLPFTQL